METIKIFDYIEKSKETSLIKEQNTFVFRWEFEIISFDAIEKAIHYYVNSDENQRLGRVGQKWGTEEKFQASLKNNPKYEVRDDKAVSGVNESSFLDHFETLMKEKGITRLRFNIKEERNTVMLDDISAYQGSNKLYKLGPGHYEIVHYSHAEKQQGGKDFYDQFKNHPEDAIRFILAKWKKEPETSKRQTICKDVLRTNFSRTEQNVKVNLTHYTGRNSGIVHAVKDHYQEQHSNYESPEEMAEVIREVLETGFVNKDVRIQKPSPDAKMMNRTQSQKAVLLDKDKNDGYFVDTAYNFILSDAQKERTPDDKLNHTTESFIEKSVRGLDVAAGLNSTNHQSINNGEVINLIEKPNSKNNLSYVSSQFSHKDTASLFNMQQTIEKSENMTIFEWIKSQFKPPVECVMKGVHYYRVEGGWIPKVDHETTSIIISNDKIEKARKPAQIGEIREWRGRKMKKTANGWVPVSKGKQPRQEEESEGKNGKPELKPEIKDKKIVAKWKEKIQNGERPPVLVSDKDESRIIDGNHKLKAYQELGIDPPIYKMDRKKFLIGASQAKDDVKFIKDAIESGDAQRI